MLEATVEQVRHNTCLHKAFNNPKCTEYCEREYFKIFGAITIYIYVYICNYIYVYICMYIVI